MTFTFTKITKTNFANLYRKVARNAKKIPVIEVDYNKRRLVIDLDTWVMYRTRVIGNWLFIASYKSSAFEVVVPLASIKRMYARNIGACSHE